LYQALLEEADSAHTRICAFSTRQLMALAQLPNYSAVRRALHGLINKLSIEDYRIAGDLFAPRQATVYLIFSPEEILARRASNPYAGPRYSTDPASDQAVERVADFHGLSRREAQVALCCVEGLTNTEIGKRLHISEQTVKYHMRHIFVKYGVRRRTELVSRLLSQAVRPEAAKESFELPVPHD
jgi:DNA-binding NarL/FixJ family response regulator